MAVSAGVGVRSQPRRIGRARVAAAVFAAALLGLTVGVAIALLAAHRTATSPHALAASTGLHGLHGLATWAPGARPAPPVSPLRDQTGRLLSLSALRGRTVALAFFDSRCNQACPLEGRALAAAERTVPAADRPVLVVVSVNPLDSPASVRAAARSWGLERLAPWHWLMGGHAQLARVWKAYRIFVAPPSNGDIVHTEAIYLVDRHGDERSGYLYPFVPRFVALDLKALARERLR